MIDNKKNMLTVQDTDEVEMEENKDYELPLREPGSILRINNKKRKANDDNSSSTKKKGKLESHLYKQPTSEELNQIRETENLFHSNLFRLQIEELLSAVKIKNKYHKLFDKWIEKFKNDVNEIKDAKELELMDDNLFEKFNIKIPMAKLPNECVGSFKFQPPSSITVGGSYALNTTVGPNASIDIFLEMPESLFKKIDSKNYRYIRKKAIYLAYIASHLGEELTETKTFVGHHWNPILKIVPKGNLNKKCVIYIHVVVQDTAFIVNKFTPEKNNVRRKWFFTESNKNQDFNPATPYYNNIILQDLTTLRVNADNEKLIKEYPNIRDGIILLKIWLKQREFCNNFISFNGHVITMYVLYLLHIKKLNTFMSSYQIVRNTWQNLVDSNWCKEGISICQEDKIKQRVNEYHKYYDCVFLDITGYHNVAANIQEDTFQWIRHQAKQSFDCLNNVRVNGFQILFMRKVPFYRAFDAVICFHHLKALENIVDAHSKEADKLNYGPNKYTQAVNLVLKLLKQGLGKRLTLICTLPRKVKEWNLNEEIPKDFEKLYIGLQFNQDLSFDIIEKGPGANLPEATEFRKFWGNKSELRRFKDGTICEAIIWAKGSATLAHKRIIPKKIIKYLIEQKLKLFEKSHFSFFYSQAENLLLLNRVQITKYRYSTEEAAFQIINTFNALEKQLGSLTDIPLTINGVHGCSPLFRYTEVFPPLTTVRMADDKNVVARKNHLIFKEGTSIEKTPIYLAPIEVILQLSTSGKWPDDLEGLRMTKAAFYIQIAECVRKQFKLKAHASLNHLDIMTGGLIFRCRIALQKEIGLLKRVESEEDGVLKYRDNEESIALEEQLFHTPKITGALYGLYCQQPSFGPACCLAKRWLSAQLIDSWHMPDVAVELLVASIYLNFDPYAVAQAPQVAFLRFLEYFANEYWSTDPIIVNFNNEMTREEIVQVENLFGTSREELPTLFISTPFDKQTSMWTKRAPSPLILNRISALAREALRLVEKQLFENTRVDYNPLFKPTLSEYDCVIKLKYKLLSRGHEAVCTDKYFSKIDLHPFKKHSKMRIPIIGFDPAAEYLNELRGAYGEFVLFFHDTYGGQVIGVLLKPQVSEEKDFRVGDTACQKLNKDQKLTLNISAMIEDFSILGKGLVKAIYIQSEKLKSI